MRGRGYRDRLSRREFLDDVLDVKHGERRVVLVKDDNTHKHCWRVLVPELRTR